MLKLTARRLKVTAVVPAAQLAGFVVPNGQPHIDFAVDINGRIVTGQLNARTLRRAVATIAEHGPDNVAVIVQGSLTGERIESAGITAQPRSKPA